jgi:hypothetical protein
MFSVRFVPDAVKEMPADADGKVAVSAEPRVAALRVGVEAELVAWVSVEELALVPPEFTARIRT